MQIGSVPDSGKAALQDRTAFEVVSAGVVENSSRTISKSMGSSIRSTNGISAAAMDLWRGRKYRLR